MKKIIVLSAAVTLPLLVSVLINSAQPEHVREAAVSSYRELHTTSDDIPLDPADYALLSIVTHSGFATSAMVEQSMSVDQPMRIDQNGVQIPDAKIEQHNGELSSFMSLQSGDDVSHGLIRHADSTHLTAAGNTDLHDGVAEDLPEARILQKGEANEASILQSDSYSAYAVIEQSGNGNQAGIVQNGAGGGHAYIMQTGIDGFATIQQTGGGQLASIIQASGNGNSASIMQSD